MPGWEGEPEQERGEVLIETFETGDTSREFKECLRQLGKRRKRYAGWKRSWHLLGAGVVLGLGFLVALAGTIFALAGPLPSPGSRLGVLLASVGALVLAGLLAWLLRVLQLRDRAVNGVALDFHDGGAVYRGTETTRVFTWAAIGKVMFRPDSTPGRTSDLVISLAPEEGVIHGQAMQIEVLRNALVLTSEYYPLNELYGIARHLHTILGHLRVVCRPRDRRLYRLD